LGNLRSQIRDTILQFDDPFNLTDLIFCLKKYYGISNRTLIMTVLDELCENGIIEYSEVKPNCWAFQVVSH